MYRIAIEGILGLKRQGDSLLVSPCVSPKWKEFQVNYRYGRSELHLSFENPAGAASGIHSVELDGRALSGASIPLVDDGARHQVRIVMSNVGSDAGRFHGASADSHAQSAE